MNVIAISLVVIILILFNSLYVAAEFATVSSRRTRISQLAAEGNRLAQRLLPIVEDSKQLDQYVAACQLGITFSSLALGAFGQSEIGVPFGEALTGYLSETQAENIAFITVLTFTTVFQVIIGELLPKSIAIQYPEQVALWVTWPMLVTLQILQRSKLIAFFNGSGMLILRLLGRPPEKKGKAHSPEEIELLVSESHEVGLLEDSERQLLRNAFRLRELTARQVMLHRTKLITASVDDTVSGIMERAIEAGFSRIPIYQTSIDDIIGFVHVKDLFRLHVKGEQHVQSILRDVVYVPETLPVAAIWDILNNKRKYLAIVFDEYGGTAGLITFEDLIEEIFGELQDEFDDEMALIARDQQGRVYLRGDLLVSDVNEYLELKLPTETADTLSGLVFSELGRAPIAGDQVTIGDTIIQVEVMEDLGVAEVSLQLPQLENVNSFTEWEVADHE